MNLIATCLLSFAILQSAQDDEATVRRMAWQLHQQQPTSAELLAQWQQAEGNDDLLLAAVSRGLAESDAAGALLVPVLTKYSDSAPPPAVIQLLRSAPLHADAVPLLQDLHSKQAWRLHAANTLLRWGIYPAQPEHALAIDLLALMRGGWLPANDQVAAVLALGDDFRATVLPALVQQHPFSVAECEALQALPRQHWRDFDALLVDAILLNHQSTDSPQWVDGADLLQRSWDMYLQSDRALGQRQLLEQILVQYGHLAQPDLLEQALSNAAPGAVDIALDFVRSKPMAYAVPLLLADIQQATSPADARSASIQALFQVAADAELQPLVSMLKPGTDAKILRSILTGLRLRPLKLVPGTIEALLPKLRTNDAGLAIEVLMLTADHETRVQWLPKTTALPPAVGRRAMQMAWGVDPHPDLIQTFRDFSSAKLPARRALGSAGLRAALDEVELAQHYEALLKQTDDPQLFDEYLNELRDQRSDAALEVILDWLIGAGGRGNPRSGAFASMLIEEEAATRMFQSWWNQPDGLTEAQLDWAACHLSPTLEAARQRLHQRFDQVAARSQTMFLSRLKDGAVRADVDLWNRVLGDNNYDASVRRVAAHLLFRVAADQDVATAKEWLAPSMQLLLQSKDASFQDRPWQVLARGVAAYPQLQLRQEWLAGMRALPSEYAQTFVRAVYLGFADQPLAEQLPVLQQALLAEMLKPSLRVLDPQTRPKYQQVADQYFEFFHLCLSLQAHQPSAEQDQQLAEQLLQHGTDLLADCLSLLAPAMSNWPQAGAAAKTILKATESRTSFRFPPSQSQAEIRPMSSYLVNNEFFDELRRRYDLAEVDGLQRACQLACQRWPRDRRSHLWSGWIGLTEGRLDSAQTSFSQAMQLSGWMPYVRLEPSLGLAAVEAMQSQDWDQLQVFLNNNEQSDALLRGRIVHGLLPQLSAVVGDE